jgi:hypothetical protein
MVVVEAGFPPTVYLCRYGLLCLLFLQNWLMPNSSKNLLVKLPQENLLVRLLPVVVGWRVVVVVVVEVGFRPTVYLCRHDLLCCRLLGLLLYLVFHYPYAL